MTLKKQCFECRKWKWWFLVKQRSFIFPKVSLTHPITSTDELCAKCFGKTKKAVFDGLGN